MRSYHLQSFGCRASQADGAAIRRDLEERGLDHVDASHAELFVLNTCTVTASADDDVRAAIRRIGRDHAGASILVTGCYAQRAPDDLASLPGVRWVVGNSHKGLIGEMIGESSEAFHGEIRVGAFGSAPEFLSGAVDDAAGDRTRPNLKIQDGCNNRCSFCIIPSVRGPSRSADPEDVVRQVRLLGGRYREIVLSGINLGRWGREPGSQVRLHDLLRRLLAETDARRLRLSSIEPMDFSDDLLRLMADSDRIARHVHAPLQSGSDTVLRRMKRKYRTRHYEERIKRAHEWMPDAAIGADVMVGFPGETPDEFSETLDFVESLPFTYLHVFTYSERPGTAAPRLGEAVPMEVRRKRNELMRGLSDRKNLSFRQKMLGRILSAVTLRHGALTSNFIRVDQAQVREPNQLVDLQIGALTAGGLREQALLPVLTAS